MDQLTTSAALLPEPPSQRRIVDVRQCLIGAEFRVDARRDDFLEIRPRFRQRQVFRLRPVPAIAFSIAGGGDTVAAINKFGIANRIDYISTAGGAFLEFLEGKTLPAVKALEERTAG